MSSRSPAGRAAGRMVPETRVADGLRLWLGNPFAGRRPAAPAALVAELLAS